MITALPILAESPLGEEPEGGWGTPLGPARKHGKSPALLRGSSSETVERQVGDAQRASNIENTSAKRSDSLYKTIPAVGMGVGYPILRDNLLQRRFEL